MKQRSWLFAPRIKSLYCRWTLWIGSCCDLEFDSVIGRWKQKRKIGTVPTFWILLNVWCWSMGSDRAKGPWTSCAQLWGWEASLNDIYMTLTEEEAAWRVDEKTAETFRTQCVKNIATSYNDHFVLFMLIFAFLVQYNQFLQDLPKIQAWSLESHDWPICLEKPDAFIPL